ENRERDHADQRRAMIGELRDLDRAITSLNSESDGAVNSKGCGSGRRPSPSGSKLPEPQLLDQMFRERKGCRSGGEHRVVHVEPADLIGGDLSFQDLLNIEEVFDLGRNDYFAHLGCLHRLVLASFGTQPNSSALYSAGRNAGAPLAKVGEYPAR